MHRRLQPALRVRRRQPRQQDGRCHEVLLDAGLRCLLAQRYCQVGLANAAK